MTIPIAIRQGRPDDVPAMHALDLTCFAPPFAFSRGLMRRFATQPNAIVLVAESGLSLAGFVIVHIERRGTMTAAYVTTLDVAAQFRRAGLARKLMQEAEQEAEAAGAERMWLHVFTGNEGAIRFYEACGYVRQRYLSGFYDDPRSAFEYAKEL